MANVEQAVFTSAETDRSAGYQVVARSPGVCPADARELTIWGPSHDSLLELGPDAVSFNFHPLPSGAYCISRTTPAGWEYSGRGGHRVYTQCLIVPEEVLGRFGNNPFALIRAAQAGGMLEVHDQVPKQLPSLRLAGGATPVDQSLLVRLATNPGPRKLALLVQAAFDSPRLAVSGPPSAAQLIAGLFSCLPTQCRPEFSFSTGLKFSSRRPFRIVALSDDQAEQRWLAHQNNVTVLNLADDLPPESVPIDGWARLIQRVAVSGRTSFLATQLSKRRFNLTLDDLPALGLQLLEDLDASALCKDHLCKDHQGGGDLPTRPQQEDGDWTLFSSDNAPNESEGLRRAHAAHRRFEKNSDAATVAKLQAVAPSKTLQPNSPQVLEKLEQLDDVVYDAISGQATSLQQLETLWPQLLAELGDDLIAESREHYLRYALLIWEDCVRVGNVRNPARAVQALDVLCLLFDEE